MDIDIEKVIGCVSRAAPVYQGDVRKTLAGFPDDSFDWIVFSRTMEELNNPCEVIEKALQVAKRVVVSFVNHGYWRNRLHYFLNGSRIINDVYDKAWHERTPINPIAIHDFEKFCRDRNLVLRRRVCLGGDWKTHCRVLPNLFAGVAIYEVRRT